MPEQEAPEATKPWVQEPLHWCVACRTINTNTTTALAAKLPISWHHTTKHPYHHLK